MIDEKALAPADLLIDQITENLLREDPKPIEQARAYRTLMELNGWSGNRLSQELAIAQPTVAHALALLELPTPFQEKVERGEIAPATAYEASKIEDQDIQRAVLDRVAAEGLTRDQTAALIRKVTGHAAQGKAVAKGGRGKPGPPEPRVYRARLGKITVELKKVGGLAMILATLREVVAMVEAQQSADDSEVA